MRNITLSFAGHSVEWDALPESSQIALATLGFSTKIKNSIAGMKAGILGTSKSANWSEEELAEEAARLGLASFARDESTADAICAAAQAEMFRALCEGIEPSARRGGPRQSPDDKLRREIAIETLEAQARKQGKALPKRSKKEEREAFDALLAKVMLNERFAAIVEKEFADRKRKAAKVDFDLGDLI